MATGRRHRAERRVGELAAATGLTVRTLHYYEQIGLLVPSGRSDTGHRLYDETDVARLYRICLLRRTGLPLAEIGQALDDPAWNLPAAMSRHLDQLDRRYASIGRLRGRLAGLLRAGDTQTTDDLLAIVEEMTMLDTTVQARITLLVYKDIAAAHDWLVRVFGLGPGRIDRDEQSRAVHGELRAGDGVIWLHGEQEDDQFQLRSPRSLGVATATTAVMVDDVDAHCRRAKAAGAVVVQEPVDQPYGYRLYSAKDLEGHFWSFMKPLD